MVTMREYVAPAIEVSVFETKDVITVSGLICVVNPAQNSIMSVTYDSLWENN